ncbi:MAG: hypothetical protein ACK4SX_08245 [Alcanivoracaceae bacterium]
MARLKACSNLYGSGKMEAPASIFLSVLVLAAVCLLLGVCGQVRAASGFYAHQFLEGHSDSFPVHSLIHGLDKHYRSGEFNFVVNRTETGLRRGETAWGVLYRYEAYADASRAASELIWRVETDQDIPAQRDWPLQLQVNQVAMQGMVVSRRVDLADGLALTAAFQLLHATQMMDGIVQGHITTYDDEYQGQLHLHYFYTRDALWDRPVDRRRGQGLALDVTLDWQIDTRQTLRLVLLDAANGIYWKDMYYTRSDLDSDRYSYDADGRLEVRAAMTGFEGNRSHWQRLPVKALLDWQGQIGDQHQLGLEAIWIDKYRDLRLSYQPRVLGGLYMSGGLQGSLGLGFRADRWHIGMSVESLNWHESRAVGLRFSWQ